MKSKLGAAHPPGTPPGTTYGSAADVLSFWPSGSGGWVLPVITIATLIGINWWASWYPGSEPGGGGYVVQNMLACRNERESRMAALFFNIAHYAMRSWPWVVTALCSLAIYGGSVKFNGVEDPGRNYVHMMVDFLPAGLRGLMLASFAAAYSSTIATQMNWGSSYLMNDLYRRFIKRKATEAHYVRASRMATLLTVILSLIVTVFMDQVSHAWEFLLMLGAGTGLVYILRWYWWRVNAWSEVSAMAASFFVSLGLRFAVDTATPTGFALNLIITTVATTVVWLVVTMVTKPEPLPTLERFYTKVRPAGMGWKPISRVTGVQPRRLEIGYNAMMWVAGVVMVYSVMFATGALIFGDHHKLLIFGSTLAVSLLALIVLFAREPVES